MTINETTTVREVAIEMPQATRIFEKLGIDYCCGGKKPLEEACAAAGVATSEVLRALNEATQSAAPAVEIKDFASTTLTELANYIVNKHHLFTRDELARLNGLLDKVRSVHGANHPELLCLQTLFKELSDALMPHMLKEEMVLFPFIARMEDAAAHQQKFTLPPFGTVRNPVRMMVFEHDRAGEVLREMRQFSSNYTVPADACISYRTLYEALAELERDLHQHIHLENNVLFPRAVELEDGFVYA